MVFFDIEEHQISTDRGANMLAEIPKLGTQWKIIHEFKPTKYIQHGISVWRSGLVVKAGDPVHSRLVIAFKFPNISVFHHIYEGDDPFPPAAYTMSSTQLPKVGEWTKLELSHEEVDGKYFLSFSVGGREVGRKEAGPDLRNLTNVEIEIGGSRQPGFIRRLVVLEKQ